MLNASCMLYQSSQFAGNSVNLPPSYLSSKDILVLVSLYWQTHQYSPVFALIPFTLACPRPAPRFPYLLSAHVLASAWKISDLLRRSGTEKIQGNAKANICWRNMLVQWKFLQLSISLSFPSSFFPLLPASHMGDWDSSAQFNSSRDLTLALLSS